MSLSSSLLALEFYYYIRNGGFYSGSLLCSSLAVNDKFRVATYKRTGKLRLRIMSLVDWQKIELQTQNTQRLGGILLKYSELLLFCGSVADIRQRRSRMR